MLLDKIAVDLVFGFAWSIALINLSLMIKSFDEVSECLAELGSQASVTDLCLKYQKVWISCPQPFCDSVRFIDQFNAFFAEFSTDSIGFGIVFCRLCSFAGFDGSVDSSVIQAG